MNTYELIGGLNLLSSVISWVQKCPIVSPEVDVPFVSAQKIAY